MTTKKFSLPRLAVVVPAVALGAGLLLAPLDSLSARVPQAAANKPGQTSPAQTGTAARPSEGRRNEQRPPGPPQFAWWKDEAIKKYIGLSQERADEIERIYQEREKNFAPLIAEYEALRKERDILISERKVSSDDLLPKVVKVEALRSKLNESRTIMLYRFSQRLTAEQYRKLLEAAEQRVHANRGGRGDNSPR